MNEQKKERIADKMPVTNQSFKQALKDAAKMVKPTKKLKLW